MSKKPINLATDSDAAIAAAALGKSEAPSSRAQGTRLTIQMAQEIATMSVAIDKMLDEIRERNALANSTLDYAGRALCDAQDSLLAALTGELDHLPTRRHWEEGYGRGYAEARDGKPPRF